VPDTAALPLLLRQESTDKGTCVHVAPKVMPLARVDHRCLSDRTAVVAYLQGFWPQMPKAVQSCIHVASLALGSLRAGLTVSSITTSLPTSRFGIKRTTAPLGVEVNSLLALLAGLSEERTPHIARIRGTHQSTGSRAVAAKPRRLAPPARGVPPPPNEMLSLKHDTRVLTLLKVVAFASKKQVFSSCSASPAAVMNLSLARATYADLPTHPLLFCTCTSIT
jgi:hypothetical protein